MKYALLMAILLIVFIASCGGGTPTTDQVKADLLGQTMGNIFSGGWKFESLAEFEELKIVNKRQESNVLEYEVDMRLRDIDKGNLYIAEALIVYRKTGDTWQIASISKKSLQKIR